MKKKTKYFKTGLFVLASIAILFGFVLLLGARNLFSKKYIFETYFNESVHGLDVGSTVKYRGVPIGNVKEIKFVQEEYELPIDDDRGRYVMITMALRSIFGKNVASGNIEGFISEMRKDGLRVKITSQGLTGTSYLEIDFVNPERNQEMKLSWKPENLYIPSTSSTFTKIGASVDDILEKIKEADIEKFVENLDRLIVTLDKAVIDMKVDTLSSSSISLINELRQTNSKLNKILDDPKMQGLPESLNSSLTKMNKSMGKLDTILSGSQSEISVTIENLRAVSEDLREVSGNAKKYPSLLLFGEAPNAPTKK
jgi:ABC-type transporter Mla subunit MlaD